MNRTPPRTHSDSQLELLELFDRSLDSALKAGVHPACLHAAIDGRITWLRLIRPLGLRPMGWRTVDDRPVDPRRPSPTPGTIQAHDDIFGPAPTVTRRAAAARLREFRSRAAATLEHWPRESLHRDVDAAYWSRLGELFNRAGDHAWAARVAGPSRARRAA